MAMVVEEEMVAEEALVVEVVMVGEEREFYSPILRFSISSTCSHNAYTFMPLSHCGHFFFLLGFI